MPFLVYSQLAPWKICNSRYCRGRPTNKPGYLYILNSLRQCPVNLIPLCLNPSLAMMVVAVLDRMIEPDSVLVECPPDEANSVMSDKEFHLMEPQVSLNMSRRREHRVKSH